MDDFRFLEENVPDYLNVAINVSDALLDVKEEHEICKILGEAVNEILPGALFAITKLQVDDLNFRIVYSYGFDKYFDFIKKIIGKDPYLLDFPISRLSDEQIEAFERRQVHHFKGGLYEVTQGSINKTVCKSIEKVLGISSIIGVCFNIEKKYYGGMTIFIPSLLAKTGIINDKSESALLLVTNQASSVIQKLHNKSERDKAEELLVIKDFALENSPTPVGLADLNRILFYANNAFLKLWGYNNKTEVSGRHTSEFARSCENVEQVLSSIRNGDKYYGEVIAIRADGTELNTLISASLVKSAQNTPLCLMALFVDITERKNLEKALIQQSEKLKELNTAKDKFLSIIAHDLKGPFNSLIGFSDLLNTEYEKLEEHQRKLYIKSIYESVISIYNLLENLLEWSRIQRECIIIAPTTLGLKDLVIKSIDPYIANSNKKEQKVINQIPDNICITADFQSMRTVIGNLFANSVKYTPNEGVIEFFATQTDSEIVLNIKDTGVGMSVEKTEKLFRIEESVSTPGTNREPGTGLGLIICREYVEKNKCKIGVISEPAKGTTISISFPVAETKKSK